MENLAGSGCELLIPTNERKPLKEIERSIIKKYRSKLWTPFMKAIQEFDLIEENDKIAVAISGGKDSLVLAKLLQELKKHGNKKIDLEFIAMDPGWHESNRRLLEDLCEYLEIPVTIFETQVFNIAEHISKDYPCYMCARLRRGALYTKAKELGCNKLALGHHFNDVIETTMLNLFYAGNFRTMLPKLKAENFENMILIRPLYYVREHYIKAYTSHNGMSPMNCGCMVASKKTSSKRKEIKEFIENYKKVYIDIDKSIMAAAKNVDFNGIVGWKVDGEKHSYLDEFDTYNVKK